MVIFRQDKFDEVWPFLRVLACSFPWGNQASAKGLQTSMLFMDKERVGEPKVHHGISIFLTSKWPQ